MSARSILASTNPHLLGDICDVDHTPQRCFPVGKKVLGLLSPSSHNRNCAPATVHPKGLPADLKISSAAVIDPNSTTIKAPTAVLLARRVAALLY